MKNLLLACGAAALALAATDAAALNKCIDEKGKVTYQDTACPQNVKAETIRAPAPAPGDSAESEPAKAAPDEGNPDREDPHMATAVSTLATYEVCANASPDWAAKNAAMFGNWRAKNEKLLTRIPKSPRYETMLKEIRNRTTAQAAMAPEKFSAFCEGQFASAVAKNYAK